MFDFARSGDLVVVVALDRLGRSLSGVIRTLEELAAAGVLLRSLREGIDYSPRPGRCSPPSSPPSPGMSAT